MIKEINLFLYFWVLSLLAVANLRQAMFRQSMHSTLDKELIWLERQELLLNAVNSRQCIGCAVKCLNHYTYQKKITPINGNWVEKWLSSVGCLSRLNFDLQNFSLAPIFWNEKMLILNHKWRTIFAPISC